MKKVKEYQWTQRSECDDLCRRCAEGMARKFQRDDKLGHGKFAFDLIVNDAEMYLRMGYEPNEVTLMQCSDGASVVYRLYPKTARYLKGRKRA